MNGLKCGVPIYDFPIPSWNKSKKQTYAMTPIKLVIHNTYNKATAKAEASYMAGNSNWTSFHSAVDESSIFECVPFNRNTWHCGNQYGNLNYIGVEIARSTGTAEQFAGAERNAAKYAAAILKKYGWGLDRMVTHQYCSGKYCPHKTLDLGWARFQNMVTNEMKGVTNVPLKYQKAGYSVKVVVPKGDTLKVRKEPTASSQEVYAYNPASIIWAEEKVTNGSGEVWYKIPSVGYVHSGFCQVIPKNLPTIILYLNEGDKLIADHLNLLLGGKTPVYRDDGTRTKKDFNILYVGGQGKNRRETAKYVYSTYL